MQLNIVFSLEVMKEELLIKLRNLEKDLIKLS